RRDDASHLAPARVDRDVRDLLVERAALGREALEHGAGVRRLQQRPIACGARSPQLLVDGRRQIDDGSGLRPARAVRRVRDGAAAGRDEAAALGGELGEAFPLPLAKAPLALLLEDERDIDAGAPLDLGVAVEEAEAQRLRELAGDSRL